MFTTLTVSFLHNKLSVCACVRVHTMFLVCECFFNVSVDLPSMSDIIFLVFFHENKIEAIC